MTKLLYLSLITLSFLIIQVHTIFVLNNLTLPNDILSKIFVDHMQHKNPSVSTTELKDSEKCILGLKEILNSIPSFNALPFTDAWGQIPSGLLYGHFKDLGNFEECLDISTNLSEPIGLANGKYCFASIPIVKDEALKKSANDATARRRGYEDLATINIGICVPDFCDPDLLTEVFRNATIKKLNGAFKEVIVHDCTTAEIPRFEVVNIVGILIFSTIGLMMLLSTLYDIYTDIFDKQGKQIFLAFSIVTNIRKLFKINNFKSDKTIGCLTGIRVLSIMWVIFCHSYSMAPLLPLINIFDFIPWLKAASSLHVMMGTVSVDTFLFISGLLIAWLGFPELDKSKGKINIPLMYFHRYIRLTPPIAAVIIYTVALDKYIGTGPLKEAYKELIGNCKDNWWSTLLYIQNYANPLEICIAPTWYLAVDTQLYFLSPFILIPLWKWGRKFAPIMFLLSFLSIGYVIAIYFYHGFNTLMGILEDDQLRLTYVPTHARFSVWLIGLGLGYFMYRIKNKSIRLSKHLQILGWGVCFALILTVIYGPNFTIHAYHEKTVLEVAMYEALSRISWGIALSWLIFACHFGFGGLINSFLSHEMWQPISRLTYCICLVHYNVLSFNYGITKSDAYFSNYSIILFFWSTFGISFVAAIVLTLALESPILVIEKITFKDRQPRNGPKTKTTSTAHTQLKTSQNHPYLESNSKSNDSHMYID